MVYWKVKISHRPGFWFYFRRRKSWISFRSTWKSPWTKRRRFPTGPKLNNSGKFSGKNYTKIADLQCHVSVVNMTFKNWSWCLLLQRKSLLSPSGIFVEKRGQRSESFPGENHRNKNHNQVISIINSFWIILTFNFAKLSKADSGSKRHRVPDRPHWRLLRALDNTECDQI